VLQLVRTVNPEAALAVLPMVHSSAEMCCAAIRASAERRSLRGVRGFLEHAKGSGLARGPESRDLWRAAIVGLGALKRPQEARQVFVAMRQAGAWALEDTATVNLLLNALHTDIELQFIRCGWVGHVGWEWLGEGRLGCAGGC
jgi:hypothetical protein